MHQGPFQPTKDGRNIERRPTTTKALGYPNTASPLKITGMIKTAKADVERQCEDRQVWAKSGHWCIAARGLQSRGQQTLASTTDYTYCL